jgi:CheY-like chemotaxis protein
MKRVHPTTMAEFVLVVDDDLTSAKMRAKILEAAGYETAIAEDGFNALLNISERQPDLMITDLQMPRMSGFELLSVVRRRFPEIPVITTSGAFEPDLIQSPRPILESDV